MRSRVLVLVSLLLVAGSTQALGGMGENALEEEGAEQGTGPGERRVLVSLDTWPPNPSLETKLETAGGEVQERFAAANTLLVDAPGPAIEAIERLGSVEGVYEDEEIELFLESSKAAIGVSPQMHAAGVNGDGITMAIVDSGIEATHPGLEDGLVDQYTVDDDGVSEGEDGASKHGTHVAGILMGSGQGAASSKGDVSGVAPASPLVSLDISHDFTTSNALRAFEWIYENHEEEEIRIVTNAWGRMRSPASYDADDPITRASSALVAEGLVVVFSAGNGGGEASRMTQEATNPDVITVGASTDEGRVESYSSRGPVYDGEDDQADWTKPDLVAPGSHVVSSQPLGEPGPAYTTMNGTSMAAPHVAGAAALLLQQRSNMTPEQVKGLLVRGAEDIHHEGVDDASGAGLLDVESSLRVLEDSSDTMQRHSETSEHSQSLVGPAGAGIVFAQADLEHEDAFTVSLPENTTKIEAELVWEGDGELETRILRPDGTTARTLAVEAKRSIQIDDPRAGDWRFEVEPRDPSQGTYYANVTVTWLEPVNGSAIPFSSERTAQGSFPSMGSPLDPWAESWLPGVPNIAIMLAGGALSVTMLVGRIRK